MLDSLKTILSSSPSRGDPTVDIEGREVPLRIKRNRRARRISLRVDAVKQEIRVTMPSYAPTAEAMGFIDQKREWIASRLETAPAAVPLLPGSTVAFLGEAHEIVWDENAPRRVTLGEGEITLGGPENMVPQRILRWLKEEARRVFSDDLREYCEKAGEAVPRLSLRDPRSRWGSCSSSGTISLSWRLIMTPDYVRRSVIAHEVAHMRHMNHSPDFYAWLDHLFEGDGKAADKWLSMHGAALQIVGR